MKYYIIAGERSGDLHGSNLIKEIRRTDSVALIRAWGGDMMSEAGAEIVVHYKETAFMGFWEVLKNFRAIKRFLKSCKDDILDWNPDAVIFIDYPGFNLRIARFAKENGFKTCYYISPKIWAWNRKRVHKIKKYIDRMYCIFPFEEDFYAKYDYPVTYVGNPLIDSIKNYPYDNDLIHNTNGTDVINIGILPGSRYQEVSNMLDTISSLFEKYQNVQFQIAAVDNLPIQLYEKYSKFQNVNVHINKAYDILKFVDGAIVTSGTATLETALFNVPQVVCYKTSELTYQIAKALIKIKFISLVNLVVDEKVVDELIQRDFNTKQLSQFVEDVKSGSARINNILIGYKKVKEAVGDYNASQLTANSIYQFVNSTSK